MERMEQMASLAMDTLREGFIHEVKDILLSLEQGSQQMIDNISAAIEEALHKAAQRQQSGQKGPVAYISFSILQSNLLLNRYALQVDAWDERFLIDDNEAASEWDFQAIFQEIKPDMEAVAAKVREQMTRVQKYELKELERAYILNYFAIALDVLKATVPSYLHVIQKSPALLAPEVQFTVGAYMEQQQPFYIWRPET